MFVLFFGTEVPETSESWCPDCVIADPLIRKAISPIENAILLEAPVGARNEWKGNTTHPYRVRFGLSAIPTLFKWTKVCIMFICIYFLADPVSLGGPWC